VRHAWINPPFRSFVAPHYKEFCEKTCDILVTVRLNRAKRRLRPRGARIGRQGRLLHSSRWSPGCPKPVVSKLSLHPAGRFSDNSVHCWRISPLRTWSCGRESGCAEDRAVLGVDSGTSASEARHATGAPMRHADCAAKVKTRPRTITRRFG